MRGSTRFSHLPLFFPSSLPPPKNGEGNLKTAFLSPFAGLLLAVTTNIFVKAEPKQEARSGSYLHVIWRGEQLFLHTYKILLLMRLLKLRQWKVLAKFAIVLQTCKVSPTVNLSQNSCSGQLCPLAGNMLGLPSFALPSLHNSIITYFVKTS